MELPEGGANHHLCCLPDLAVPAFLQALESLSGPGVEAVSHTAQQPHETWPDCFCKLVPNPIPHNQVVPPKQGFWLPHWCSLAERGFRPLWEGALRKKGGPPSLLFGKLSGSSFWALEYLRQSGAEVDY